MAQLPRILQGSDRHIGKPSRMNYVLGITASGMHYSEFILGDLGSIGV